MMQVLPVKVRSRQEFEASLEMIRVALAGGATIADIHQRLQKQGMKARTGRPGVEAEVVDEALRLEWIGPARFQAAGLRFLPELESFQTRQSRRFRVETPERVTLQEQGRRHMEQIVSPEAMAGGVTES